MNLHRQRLTFTLKLFLFDSVLWLPSAFPKPPRQVRDTPSPVGSEPWGDVKGRATHGQTDPRDLGLEEKAEAGAGQVLTQRRGW